LYAEGIAAASKDDEQIQTTSLSDIEQLSRRAETADKERDEALNKRDSVLNQIARNELLYVSVSD